MRFSANLSFLFKDVPFGERFRRAADTGFRGVEFMWPGLDQIDAVTTAVDETGLEVALFNFDAGDMAAGDRGLAGDPDRRAQFRENVPVALELAARIGCPRLNALVGVHRAGLEVEAQLEEARANVAWAAEQARAQGASILIEAVNSQQNGPYLLDTTAKAVSFLDAVGADNVALQYDVYHMQRMEGNLAETITRLLPRIGSRPDRRPALAQRARDRRGQLRLRARTARPDRIRGLGGMRVQPVDGDDRGEPALDEGAWICLTLTRRSGSSAWG